MPTKSWPDKQVLQIDAVFASKRREIIKPEYKISSLPLPLGNVAMNPRLFAKQRRGQGFFGCIDFVQQLFISSQFADKSQNHGAIVTGCWTDDQDHLNLRTFGKGNAL